MGQSRRRCLAPASCNFMCCHCLQDLDPKAAKEAKREAMRRAREEERERKEAARIEAERLAKEEVSP